MTKLWMSKELANTALVTETGWGGEEFRPTTKKLWVMEPPRHELLATGHGALPSHCNHVKNWVNPLF